MMFLRAVRHDPQSLQQYAGLLAQCFPRARSSRRFSIEQLAWLYAHNPDGPALGFDAVDNDQLAAHYVLLPSRIRTEDGEVRALLSLNTATHPAYQGRGLFTQLAGMALEKARDEGFSAAYGVANANSTPGFVRKLGFDLIAPLQARVGIFVATLASPTRPQPELERIWTPESLLWRSRWPANPLLSAPASNGDTLFQAPTPVPGLWATDQLVAPITPSARKHKGPLHLFLGLHPDSQGAGTMFTLPDWLKPSPLNLIFKPLQRGVAVPHASKVRFSFLDFDAF